MAVGPTSLPDDTASEDAWFGNDNAPQTSRAHFGGEATGPVLIRSNTSVCTDDTHQWGRQLLASYFLQMSVSQV
jgi:hypothetical protein